MKKAEAQALAPNSSRMVIENIIKILSVSEKVDAMMRFTSDKVDNQNMIILDISVPKKDFRTFINLGITTDHRLILYKQLLNDLLDVFLPHETMGVTGFYMLKYIMGNMENFYGVDVVNLFESRIRVNFNGSGKDFQNLVKEYMNRYQEFVAVMKEAEQNQSKSL